MTRDTWHLILTLREDLAQSFTGNYRNLFSIFSPQCLWAAKTANRTSVQPRECILGIQIMNAACHIGGIRSPERSESDACQSVIIEDEVESTGMLEKRIEICGRNGLYNFLVQEACTEVLASEKKTAISMLH